MITAIAVEKPTAEAHIEPIGRRTQVPRDHLLELVIRLSEAEARFADKSYVAGVVRRSLEDFPGARSRGLGDVSVLSKKNKQGSVAKVVVGFDGSAICAGRPEDDSIARLRGELLAAGYKLVIHERRECAEAECAAEAVVDWNRRSEAPPGWFSSLVCGRHGYRTCTGCGSLFVLTTTNSPGQGPSLHCEVCGAVLVEWGSSKIWQAELITKSQAAS
jgi:hypothetical protein